MFLSSSFCWLSNNFAISSTPCTYNIFEWQWFFLQWRQSTIDFGTKWFYGHLSTVTFHGIYTRIFEMFSFSLFCSFFWSRSLLGWFCAHLFRMVQIWVENDNLWFLYFFSQLWCNLLLSRYVVPVLCVYICLLLTFPLYIYVRWIIAELTTSPCLLHVSLHYRY